MGFHPQPLENKMPAHRGSREKTNRIFWAAGELKLILTQVRSCRLENYSPPCSIQLFLLEPGLHNDHSRSQMIIRDFGGLLCANSCSPDAWRSPASQKQGGGCILAGDVDDHLGVGAQAYRSEDHTEVSSLLLQHDPPSSSTLSEGGLDTYLSVEQRKNPEDPPRSGPRGLHSSMKAAVSPARHRSEPPKHARTSCAYPSGPSAPPKVYSVACLPGSRKQRVLSELAASLTPCCLHVHLGTQTLTRMTRNTTAI
ncbi:hypothetical protein FQA47_010229 [Oryzias melastigma]|uniref:Uncharacterized protein n=1 Tax=Oryzias melastigma TaxID=30732 RepID=A0A834F3N5_ORYME|nr:hypothetical protein FQA47_010229 [Oryzias melastigma]